MSTDSNQHKRRDWPMQPEFGHVRGCLKEEYPTAREALSKIELRMMDLEEQFEALDRIRAVAEWTVDVHADPPLRQLTQALSEYITAYPVSAPVCDRPMGVRETGAGAEEQYESACADSVRLQTALDDTIDVAIWLSALVPHEGEAWATWENSMRPKLYAAMASSPAKTRE